MIKEMESLTAMRALITKEADSKGAMKFRMNKADKALHSCDRWSWNKGMVDTLHGWESKNLDLMSS